MSIYDHVFSDGEDDDVFGVFEKPKKKPEKNVQVTKKFEKSKIQQSDERTVAVNDFELLMSGGSQSKPPVIFSRTPPKVTKSPRLVKKKKMKIKSVIADLFKNDEIDSDDDHPGLSVQNPKLNFAQSKLSNFFQPRRKPQNQRPKSFDNAFGTPPTSRSVTNTFNNNRSQNFNRNQPKNNRPPPLPQKSDPLFKQIDPKYHPIFPYVKFNRVQQEAFNVIFNTGINSVVSAPTSSGKTVLFELAMVREIQRRAKGIGRGGTMIYVSPLKALCQERLKDWTRKFGRVGIKVMQVTGDSGNISVHNIVNCDVIVTTPEKWDSVTRRMKERSISKIVENVSLVMIDEVHLLNERQRGGCLEVIICRMKTLKEMGLRKNLNKPICNVRFIAISATIPNIHDVGLWMDVSDRRGMMVFGDEYRPCPLKKFVYGYNYNPKGEFMFIRGLSYKVNAIINQHSGNKNTLIFCSSRKDTVDTAKILANSISFDQHALPNAQDVRDIKKKDLKDLLLRGIGYHNAGLDYSDRGILESLFISGKVKVLCSTTTLAQGINLPAHLVIIKGTKMYRKGSGYVDMDALSVKQMCGRAGRPQFDSFGVCVIMTNSNTKGKYENVFNNLLIVESHLYDMLLEHINSELCLGNIRNVGDAEQWIKSTFFYICASKRPNNYPNIEVVNGSIINSIRKIIIDLFNALQENSLIKRISDTSNDVIATEIGKCMSKYYIMFNTMTLFSQINENYTERDLLSLLSKAINLQLLNNTFLKT